MNDSHREKYQGRGSSCTSPRMLIGFDWEVHIAPVALARLVLQPAVLSPGLMELDLT